MSLEPSQKTRCKLLKIGEDSGLCRTAGWCRTGFIARHATTPNHLALVNTTDLVATDTTIQLQFTIQYMLGQKQVLSEIVRKSVRARLFGVWRHCWAIKHNSWLSCYIHVWSLPEISAKKPNVARHRLDMTQDGPNQTFDGPNMSKWFQTHQGLVA